MKNAMFYVLMFSAFISYGQKFIPNQPYMCNCVVVMETTEPIDLKAFQSITMDEAKLVRNDITHKGENYTYYLVKFCYEDFNVAMQKADYFWNYFRNVYVEQTRIDKDLEK